jgi:hypothetical protein
MLSGEAGVGKTRLATEFAQFARAGGAKVLEGRASHHVRIPFGIWQQVLSSRIDQGEVRITDCDGESSGEDLRRLIDMPSSQLQIAPTEPMEAAGRILADDARIQPLVLILDDLHAADALSLDAFRVFARRLSNLGSIVVGIYRDSERVRFPEFAELLGDPIARDGQRIMLQAFDDNEIREFVGSRTSRTIDGGLLQSLVELTGGNPRLLDMVVRHNLLNAEKLPIGARIRALLRTETDSHIDSLSPTLRQILQVAAVIGVEFESSLLMHAANQGAGDLLDALAEAECGGFIIRTGPGRFRFRQSLIREVVYEDLAGAERARLHLRIAEVLEELHSHSDEYLSRLAGHFYDAAMVGGARKAVVYCRRGAEFAERSGQLKEAAGFYEMAISALELLREEDPSHRRELNVKHKDMLARVQRHTGQSAAADESQAEPEVIVEPNRIYTDAAPSIASDPAKDTEANPATGSAAASHAEASENEFRREGDFWTLKYEGKLLRLRHGNGLVFVAYLLKHPDQEFHVAQLTGLLGGSSSPETMYLSHSEKQRLGIRATRSTDPGPLLDGAAKLAYRNRIEELRSDLEEAKSRNDIGRAEKAAAEIELVAAELSHAVGLGGRDRKHGAETQRARVNVTNAIRALTAKIAPEHASLARYLRLTIHTGYFCSYSPDPRSAPRWRF